MANGKHAKHQGLEGKWSLVTCLNSSFNEMHQNWKNSLIINQVDQVSGLLTNRPWGQHISRVPEVNIFPGPLRSTYFQGPRVNIFPGPLRSIYVQDPWDQQLPRPHFVAQYVTARWLQFKWHQVMLNRLRQQSNSQIFPLFMNWAFFTAWISTECEIQREKTYWRRREDVHCLQQSRASNP